MRDVTTFSNEELVWMFNHLDIENEQDEIWAREIYSELTRRGLNSDGSLIHGV